ncbi:YkvA family protein [Clostridium sp.]|uniref:YkvA family protein n=1 Tax=Clostridium sp. TaxID=1506 RepID=UPI003FD8D2A8
MYAKVVVLLVVGYALSPIDTIPDFIPVLGYLDDLILVPICVAFAIRLIPEDIMSDCREQSKNIFKEGKAKNWFLRLKAI